MQTQNESQPRQRAPYTRFRDNVDFNALPPEALLKISDVMIVTAMGRSQLETRIANDEFPQPLRLGRDRIWRWGDVLQWLRLAGEGGDAQ